MHYTIYKTINLVNNKFYIGKHQTENINDSYLGSGVALVKAIEKYGIDNFRKEVLFIFETEDEMNLKEVEIVTPDFIERADVYNSAIGGEGGPHFKGRKHSKETKARITNSLTGKHVSQETKDKLSKAFKGRFFSEETRRKISEKRKSRTAIDKYEIAITLYRHFKQNGFKSIRKFAKSEYSLGYNHTAISTLFRKYIKELPKDRKRGYTLL